jgi:tryptophan synthase beta chain
VEFAATLRKDQNIIVNLSGRGDKDIPTMAKIDGISIG